MTELLTDLDRPLKLHPLTYLDEGDEVTVGRTDINSFGLFPPDGAALLRRLEAGESPNAAAAWYAAEYGETVDMSEFMEVLEELELLVKDGETVAAPAAVRWQRLGAALFSPVAWVIYGLLAAAAIAAMVSDHTLIPHYRNIFFTRSSLVILSLGIFLGQAPWLLVHEAYHALAGRRLGLNSTLRISRRFYYIVFETALDGLVSVPRRKRYLPMLAGIIADVLVIAVLTLVAFALRHGTGAVAYLDRFLLSMAFVVVLRLAWQLYFFLRTDLYVMVTTVLGCNDLQTAAKQRLRNHAARLLHRPSWHTDPATWHPRDAQVARWYSWLMAAGYVVLGVILVTTAFPVGVRVTEQAWHEIVTTGSALKISDAGLFLILNFWEPVLAGYLAVRAFRKRRAAKAAAPAPAAAAAPAPANPS
jgi:hypothetical protein